MLLVEHLGSMQPDSIYFDFIRCEDKSGDLYLDLSIRFSGETDLSWFWVDMAMGRKQKAGLLHYCLENKVFAPDLPEPLAIQHLTEHLDELLQRAADPELGLKDAFEIAAQLESSGINDICSKLAMPIEGPAHVLQKKQDLLAANPFAKLQSGAARFNVKP
jgi:hypothetical protein